MKYYASLLILLLVLFVGCAAPEAETPATPPTPEVPTEPAPAATPSFADEVPADLTESVANITLSREGQEPVQTTITGLYAENSSWEHYSQASPQTVKLFFYGMDADGRSLIFSGELAKGLQTESAAVTVYLPGQTPALDHELVNSTLEFTALNLEAGFCQGTFSGEAKHEATTDTVSGDFTILGLIPTEM